MRVLSDTIKTAWFHNVAEQDFIRSLTQQRLNCGEKRQPEKLSTGSLQGTLWRLCRQFPSQCQLVDQLTALSAYLKHYLLNYWNCLCCVFVRKWFALCMSKDPSTQKRCCVQPICWPIYPSQKGILFLVTQHINLRNKTTELAHPIHNQKNQNLDQWYLATKQRMSGLSTLGWMSSHPMISCLCLQQNLRLRILGFWWKNIWG